MKMEEIGKKISELRSEKNFTQMELAEGICTQASISLIEKGELEPNASILSQIARKLGVDINYFFEISSTPRLDYVNEVEKQLRALRVVYKYEEMMDYIKTEEKNPLFYRDPNKMQLLLWHKSIYAFEVEKDHPQAVSHIQSAFHLTKNSKRAYTELEMEMILTLGVFEYREEDFKKAIKHFNQVEEALEGSKRIPADKSIYSRLYYHSARAHTRLGNLDHSISLATKGIDWCLEYDQLYLMPVLHYQVAYNYELMNNFEKALEFLDHSIQLFELYPENPGGNFVRDKRLNYLHMLKK
ncbi:helix-turn-helix transcriptional regulator [Rossellomorea marisflavi]|uniref:helix-turn-helix transcriptional regulator n=1 Tax=Rossellomorea marisflavi TaxID=189381 RepID=UPI00295EC058|nr:helix-turn-helix transcriptional regulator [Rossellomorea marisflavi]